MKLLFLTILLSFSLGLYSQVNTQVEVPDSLTYNAIDVATYFKSNYSTKEDLVNDLYLWIIHNINYSDVLVDSLSDKDLVDYVLTTKAGKCKHFSALLTCICSLSGIEAYSVLGYVKLNDEVETTQDHAWNVIKLDGEYYLFDPTWDSQNNDMSYFRKSGEVFIKTHMPYDPMMQLQYYPVRHTRFFKGKTTGRYYFDYKQAFKEYQNLNQEEQLKLLLFRAEEYGINNFKLDFLYIRLKHFVKDYSDFYF